jgi:phosphate transport system permease protein
VGGWALLLLPLAILVVVLVVNRLVTPALRRAFTDHHREQVAWMEVAKFAVSTVAAILLALGMGALLALFKLDPRFDFMVFHTDMSPMDIYVQRNALIVGVVMGFAVIPIVYTIGDDALTAVPDHLRSASLGCGATTWQTAIRIVIPTAMSGLFSALMIGLGRAVGETMIVLMALGNTAIMDWNIFSGARTLSANIAVELPEAVRNSAHYRTLFLAGLVLFAMTFVVNTIAESVRLRFRKRAYQL